MVKVFEAFAGYARQRMALNISRKLKLDKLKGIYLSNEIKNNYRDIQQINPGELPNFYLLTYLFPCQDISLVLLKWFK